MWRVIRTTRSRSDRLEVVLVHVQPNHSDLIADMDDLSPVSAFMKIENFGILGQIKPIAIDILRVLEWHIEFITARFPPF